MKTMLFLAKLSEIISKEMEKDGVMPKIPWKPARNTKEWLESRRLRMDYLTGTNNYSQQRSGRREWEIEKEGFTTAKIKRPPGIMKVYVPTEMVEKIVVLGSFPTA